MASHALVCGVSAFKDARLATLNAPANDVQALATLLRDPERGAFDSVTVSIDDDFLTMRDRVVALFNKRDPDDLLLLYYSGHGVLPLGNRLFLATPETDLDNPQARSLAASEVRDLMDQTRAERQVLVLDCCHSGAFAVGAKGAGATAVSEDTFGAGSTGRYVLTASDAQQFAWDGNRLASGDAGQRTLSHFTSYVVDGIGKGEAAPDDPDITLDALYRYIYRRAKADGSPATPQRFLNRSSGDVVIARNPAVRATASLDTLAVQLASEDWEARLDAATALQRLVRKPLLADAARDAAADRYALERDFKVRAALLRVLQLSGNAPEDVPPKQAAPEPAKPPKPDPVAKPNDALYPPELSPTYPDSTPAAMRTRKALEAQAASEQATAAADAKSAQTRVASDGLIAVQAGWVAQEAKAVRNSKWTNWAVWSSIVIVPGLFNLGLGVSFMSLVGLLIGCALGLIPTPMTKEIMPPPGVTATIRIVRTGLVSYEREAYRRACWIGLALGAVMLIGVGAQVGKV